jgi:hypothetical protein
MAMVHLAHANTSTNWPVGSNVEVQQIARAWLEGIEEVGLVHVPFTGETDISTWVRSGVTTPAVIGQRYFRFNDALQATRPVFIRVEIMTSSNGIFPRVTLASAVNGTGGLAGVQNGSAIQHGVNLAGWTETSIAGGPNYLGFYPHISTSRWWSIERSKDAFGNDTGDFVSQHGSMQSQSLPLTAGEPIPAPTNFVSSTMSLGSQSQVYGNVLGLGPIYPMVGLPQNPIVGAVLFRTNDMPATAMFDATLYGVSRTYRGMGTVSGSTQDWPFFNSSQLAAVLWQ